jgi:adenine phosphoribosyltransferase
MMHLEEEIKKEIKDIPNFPKEGIVFKDLTPLLKNSSLSNKIVTALSNKASSYGADAIVCLESRGFWYGLSIAMACNVPMIPIRKKGKLPDQTIGIDYNLEYGSARIEIHKEAITPGMKVYLHDDLLATGGTAKAATQLIQSLGGEVVGFGCIVELTFLNGRNFLKDSIKNIDGLVSY